MNNPEYYMMRPRYRQLLEDLKEAKPEAAALLEYAEQQMQEDGTALFTHKDFLRSQNRPVNRDTVRAMHKRAKLLLDWLAAQKLDWADASWQYSTRILGGYVLTNVAVALNFASLMAEYILHKREAGK